MRRRVMRALWGFGEIAEKTPQKKGVRGRGGADLA